MPTKMSAHLRIDGMAAAILALKLATMEAPVQNILADSGMAIW
jgi:hypothetical protein